MSCETFVKTINGNKIEYTQLPARKSLLLKFRISKIFSEAMPELLTGRGKTEKGQLKAFSSAITSILKNSSSEELTNLIFDVAESASINEKPIDVDEMFSGDLPALYGVCFWILKKEYASFLDAVIELVGSNPIKEAIGKKTTSQT